MRRASRESTRAWRPASWLGDDDERRASSELVEGEGRGRVEEGAGPSRWPLTLSLSLGPGYAKGRGSCEESRRGLLQGLPRRPMRRRPRFLVIGKGQQALDSLSLAVLLACKKLPGYDL